MPPTGIESVCPGSSPADCTTSQTAVLADLTLLHICPLWPVLRWSLLAFYFSSCQFIAGQRRGKRHEKLGYVVGVCFFAFDGRVLAEQYQQPSTASSSAELNQQCCHECMCMLTYQRRIESAGMSCKPICARIGNNERLVQCKVASMLRYQQPWKASSVQKWISGDVQVYITYIRNLRRTFLCFVYLLYICKPVRSLNFIRIILFGAWLHPECVHSNS